LFSAGGTASREFRSAAQQGLILQACSVFFRYTTFIVILAFSLLYLLDFSWAVIARLYHKRFSLLGKIPLLS
jgi:hypothetical protein